MCAGPALLDHVVGLSINFTNFSSKFSIKFPVRFSPWHISMCSPLRRKYGTLLWAFQATYWQRNQWLRMREWFGRRTRAKYIPDELPVKRSQPGYRFPGRGRGELAPCLSLAAGHSLPAERRRRRRLRQFDEAFSDFANNELTRRDTHSWFLWKAVVDAPCKPHAHFILM